MIISILYQYNHNLIIIFILSFKLSNFTLIAIDLNIMKELN